MTTDNNKKGLIERLLSSVTEVHASEIKMALLMTITIFLILTSYLIAKVVREPLILSGGGAEVKSYASAIQVGLLLIVIQLYTMCVCKFTRRKLINTITLFFIACLVVFWFLFTFVGPVGSVVFYLWSGIFSLVLITQFWSFANDVITVEQGKRLFVLFAVGASAGGIFGPMLTGLFLDIVGLYNMLLVSAVMLTFSLLIMNYIESRTYITQTHCTDTAGAEEGEEVSHKGALKVVFQNKYLVMIAFLILLTNWVNTTGEYILSRAVEETAETMYLNEPNTSELQGNFIGSFYADFYSLVGILGLILQLFAVSRILKYFGVRIALMTLPLIALGGYLMIAVVPILMLIRVGKTAENSIDYSLNNTVRQILFLPTTREEKYKAKVAIDTFFVRAGDLLSAGLVFVGTVVLSFSITHFAVTTAVLATAWLILAFITGRTNRKLVNDLKEETVPSEATVTNL